MKKFTVMITMAMALVLCMTAVAGATLVGSVYYFEEAELTVTIPSHYQVLTRNTQEGDPALVYLNLDREAVISFLENSALYLDAFSDDTMEEITISLQKNTIDNFNNFSEDTMNQIRDSLPSVLSSNGMEMSKSELYITDAASFIKIYYFDSTLNSHVLQYYTIYDYQTINFRMYNRAGEAVTAAQEQILKRIVDTAIFNTP